MAWDLHNIFFLVSALEWLNKNLSLIFLNDQLEIIIQPDFFNYHSSRYTVQNVFKVSEATNWDVSALAASEVRIIILYCTQTESSMILERAAKFGENLFFSLLIRL